MDAPSENDDGPFLVPDSMEDVSVHVENGKRWKVLEILSMVTVEPSMFLYIFAFMLTSVVEQAFFIHKACTVDLGYPELICNNLTGYKNENIKVQVVVSTFHQWNDIAGQIIPICLALFIGSWSDRRGRKFLLLLGILGKLWYSVWVVINATQDSWPLNVLVYSAILPSGLTGADLSIFAACFSYISDVSSEKDRTFRVAILDITYLVAIPVGTALGNLLFNSVVNRSYAIMFAINSCLLLLAFLYSLFWLEWTTTDKQRALVPSCCCCCSSRSSSENADSVNCLTDFFDMNHLIESSKSLVKQRPLHGRSIIIILIFAMAFYTFQRDERSMSYLYTQLEFGWNVSDFSHFRTLQSSLYVVGTLLCLPLMSKWRLRLSDTTIIMIGTMGHAIARIIYAVATDWRLFYVGAAISSVGPVVAPVIRAMASKTVPQHERGKMFAMLSVADTAVPLFSGIVYTQVYNATLTDYPSAIFWVTVATQLIVFCIALFIKLITKGHSLEECAQKPVQHTQL